MAGVNLKEGRDRFFSGQGLNYFPEVAHEQRGASFRLCFFLKIPCREKERKKGPRSLNIR